MAGVKNLQIKMHETIRATLTRIVKTEMENRKMLPLDDVKNIIATMFNDFELDDTISTKKFNKLAEDLEELQDCIINSLDRLYTTESCYRNLDLQRGVDK